VPVLAFLVDLENKPGGLAKVAEAIAAKGVNITSLSGATCGSTARAAIITSDDAATRKALGDLGCTFSEMAFTETSLRDEPGSLAKATRRLADAGVTIDALLPIGMDGGDVIVAFVTSDPVKARHALAHAGIPVR
jgi:hypothetical protein